jgi:hypothetical protein
VSCAHPLSSSQTCQQVDDSVHDGNDARQQLRGPYYSTASESSQVCEARGTFARDGGWMMMGGRESYELLFYSRSRMMNDGT